MWGREHDATHHLINPAHLSGLPGKKDALVLGEVSLQKALESKVT